MATRTPMRQMRHHAGVMMGVPSWSRRQHPVDQHRSPLREAVASIAAPDDNQPRRPQATMADPPMHGIRARLPKSPRPTPTDYPQTDPAAHPTTHPHGRGPGLTCLADTGRATALDFVIGLLSLGLGVPRGRLRGRGLHGAHIDRVWGSRTRNRCTWAFAASVGVGAFG
jgi:hypothetical protein